MSEQEAFSRLQKTSMNTRTSLAEVAHAVILMDNVQKGSN
ncbi:MAG: ANTAR domain-containing protein [Eggerthellaceae bacterium]